MSAVGHADLAAVAERQLGLVTRAQAREVMSRGALQSAVRAGRLEQVRRTVYRINGTPTTWEQHVLSACLAGGVGGAASFGTASWLWRLMDTKPDRIEITVPRTRRARVDGVVVHQTMVTGSRHFTRVGPVPSTTPARTLCDMTAVWSHSWIERGVDDALRRRLTTLRALLRVFLDLATRGRRRSTIMRAVLDERMPGFQPGDSRPELRLASWLAEAGLPEPVQQHRVRVGRSTFRMDLAYPAHKIDVEYDGWETHRSRLAFDSDRDRDAMLELDGWLVLRFTSRHGRATVVERVALALAVRTK